MNESDAPSGRRAFAIAAIVLLPLIAFVLGQGALARTPVKNPHGRFREDCGLCHGAESWKPARISRKFDHARFGFPLAGAHRSAPCTACHVTLEFARAASRCASCHEDPHRGELGADCARCHTARSFIDHAGMVRAHQLTRFPLTGGHAGLECEGCHPAVGQGALQYVNAAAECQACHLDDYRATRTPDHVAANYPLDCRACHGTLTWSGAVFDHATTRFPLTGAHRAAPCAGCHGDGVDRGKSADCVSCHRADYDGAPFDHAAAGFGTQCASCHNTTAWEGAVFDHDGRFPIESGAHRRGTWNACSDCHINPASYRDFTCLSCHPHSDRAETDGHHREENGYAYESASCYACHPRGRH
jgi:hypothetical protein